MAISIYFCCLIVLVCIVWSIDSLFFGRIGRNDMSFRLKLSLSAWQQPLSSLPAANDADVARFEEILQSISVSIMKQENDAALRYATSNLKFLFSRNLPL